MVPARARSRHRAGPAGGHRRGAGSPAAQQAGTLEAARPAAPRLALLILAAALVVVGLVFLVPGERLSQGYDWFQIWAYHKEFIRSSILQDGTVPLWCRWSFSGKPFLADVESQLLYPGTLLHVLLPSRLALPLDVLVHFALAGLGMHLFCRSRGMHPWAGLFAGVAFLACGFNIAHTTVGHIHYYAAVAWMPFVFLAVEKWLEGGRAVWIALGALSVGVQFLAGAPQVSWMTIVFGGLYGGGRVLEKAWASRAPDGAARGGSSPGAGWTRARPLRAVALGLAGVGAIFALGLAVAGAQLLPTRELASLSLREGRGYEFATLDSMPPGVASHLLAPGRLGGAVEWEFYGYFGIAAIGLAAAALGARLFRRGGAVFALLALLAALMMLGDATPFFRVLYALVPGLSLFRTHAREVLVVSFSVICMAASGVDAALGGMGREIESRIRRLLPICAAGAGLLTVALAFTASDPSGAGATILWVVLAIASAAATALLGRISWLPLVLAVLVAGEAIAAERIVRERITIPSSVPPAQEALARVLRSDPGEYRFWFPRRFFMSDQGYAERRSAVEGYENMILRRYHAYVHAMTGAPVKRDVITILTQLNFRYAPDAFPFKALNVKYAAIPDEKEGYALHVNPDPCGPAFLVSRHEVLSEGAILDRMRSGEWDPRRVVLLEEPPPGGPLAEREEHAPEPAGRVTALRMGPNRISLRAQAAREAFLVLSEIHYPGWRVTVDGHARPLLRADYLLRAVRVPAGEHQIEFTFAPPALLWGGALSAAGLIACCGLLVAWAWRGRRVGQGG